MLPNPWPPMKGARFKIRWHRVGAGERVEDVVCTSVSGRAVAFEGLTERFVLDEQPPRDVLWPVESAGVS